jgi:cell division protein FtsL
MKTNIRLSIFVVTILFCLVGVKMHVNQEFGKINDKMRERDFLLEEVRILEAELAYLSNIDRVENLASQYLSLNVVAKKVVVLNNNKIKTDNVQDHVVEVKKRQNWNYKNRSNIMNIRHEVR